MAKRKRRSFSLGGTRKRIGRRNAAYMRREARRTRDAGDFYRASEEEAREKLDRRYNRSTKLPKGFGKGRFCVKQTTPQYHWNTDAFIGTESRIIRCFKKRRDALKHVRTLNAGEDYRDEHAREYTIVAPDHFKRGRTARRHGKSQPPPPRRANPDDLPF